jgi:hypothetical protein
MNSSPSSLMRRFVAWLIPYLFGTPVGWFLIRVARPILAIALKNSKLTCLGKTDGGGSQVLAILGVAAFAKFFGGEFIHTPMSFIEHCPRKQTMTEYCASWETVIDRFAFKKRSVEEFVHYSLIDFLIDFLLFRTRGKWISLGNIHYVTDAHPEIFYSISLNQEVQDKVEDSKKLINICVHVRRGDVKPEGQHAIRFTSDQEVRKNIEFVRTAIQQKSTVHIITQKPSSGFREKFKDCTIVNVNDPIKALLLLVESDILIMSKSQFSYVAALLSKNKIFYDPYWQKPLPHWSNLPGKVS